MATRTWLGNAIDIAQKNTVTIANTWATSDTATLTINGKSLVVTIGSLVTTAQVAPTIQQAVEGISFTDTTASVTPTDGKDDFPELAEYDATVSGSVVTLIGKVKGKPITLTAAYTTAGSGTATAAAVTAGTGRNDFANADNWSDETVPVTGGIIVFDSQGGSTSCLYNLAAGFANATIFINKGFTGNIGLPNRHGNLIGGYSEYRDTHLTFTGTVTANIGDGVGLLGDRIKIKAATVTVNGYASGTSSTPSEPPIQIIASTLATAHIRGGTIVFGHRDSDATVIGGTWNISGDADVTAGNGVDISSGTALTIQQKGGSFLMDEDIDSYVSTQVVTYTQTGGIATINGSKLGNVTLSGGSRFNWNTTTGQHSGTVVYISDNAYLDFSSSTGSAVNTIERYSNTSTIDDRNKAVSSLVIDNNRCSDTSRLLLGNDFKITRAATS